MDFRKMIEEKRNKQYIATMNENEKDITMCCSKQMKHNGSHYICDICSHTIDYEQDRQGMESTKRSYIKISGSSGCKYYNTSQDAEITQRKNIRDHLTKMSNNYKGYQFPEDVLDNVVDLYSQIQQEEVNRGNHKNEILASLIYFECINNGTERKRKDVAEFMQLNTGGFAGGESDVRKLKLRGVLNITIKEESVNGYAEKYMEILELSKNGAGISKYLPMIEEVISRAETSNIEINSLTSSKVIGVIWFIIIKCGFNIKIKELEEKCDKTKANTIKKFYNIIISNKELFTDIFEKYGIM
jgi:transcription initiation factor TFIIIB Brf1 subunit/transcription initiation factor TFIIB